MLCPPKPELLKPTSVMNSLFDEGEKYEPTVEILKELIEDWKHELNDTDLSHAILTGANLDNANLHRTILIGADLTGASLNKADLSEAFLVRTKLKDASLIEANLVTLSIGDLSYYPAVGKVFPGIGSLHKSYKELTVFSYPEDVAHHLLEVRTLYRAKMDDAVKKVIELQKPRLLQSPFPAPPTILQIERR